MKTATTVVDEKYEEALKRATKVAEDARKKIKFYRPLTPEYRDLLAKKHIEKYFR